MHLFIAEERMQCKVVMSFTTVSMNRKQEVYSSGTGSDIPVYRKESVKRRAECTSIGTNDKRRTVRQSPDNTPTSSKKGKRRSGLLRQKAKKGRLFMWLLFTEISSA